MSLSRTEEPSKSELVTVGIDFAKSVFQIHGIDKNGRIFVRRQLLAFFETHAPCLIGMEGITASIFHMINSLAVDAIESGSEHITDEAVECWESEFDAEAAFA